MLKTKKSKLLLTMMLIFLLLLSACGNTQHTDSTTTGSSSPTSEYKPTSSAEGDKVSEEGSSQKDKETNVQVQKNATLTFYYVDEELLTMKQKEKTISYFSEEEKWIAIWQELQNAGEEGVVSLWEDVELLEMEQEETILKLNIAKPDNLQFGSTAEGFAIQTLLQTVGQIDGIEAIQLLIEGEVEETLAGHVSIDQPIPTDEIIYTGQ